MSFPCFQSSFQSWNRSYADLIVKALHFGCSRALSASRSEFAWAFNLFFLPPVLCSRWQLSWGRGWKMYTHGGRRKFSERAPILARQKALCCQAGGRSELFKRDCYFILMAEVWGWTAKYSSFLSHRYSLFFVFSKNFLTFQFQLHHSNCNRVVVTP